MRDVKRLNKIRQMACAKCSKQPPSQACHANWHEFGKGLGKKADDDYTIPLCAFCHQQLDLYQELNREQAKAWFLAKLKQTNQCLAVKECVNGVDF